MNQESERNAVSKINRAVAVSKSLASSSRSQVRAANRAASKSPNTAVSKGPDGAVNKITSAN